MKNIFIVFLMFLFSGCTGERCIDADDFGFIKFVISSRYTKDELSGQHQDNQVAPWRNSEYKVNGQPLTIIVKSWNYQDGDRNNAQELSAWCPWYGQEKNRTTLSQFSVRLQECQFIDNKMCTVGKYAKIQNAPCLLKNGVGLYFLIAERNSNPNISLEKSCIPDGITRHLGESNSDFYDLNKRGDLVRTGGINYQYENVDKTKFVQCPLYFKILDRFYDDNNGQYRIVIKSGVSDTRPDPLDFLINLITNEFFGSNNKDSGLVKKIYQGIIDTTGYRISVSAILTLYIIFTGFSFLIGNINITHTELIVRISKVIIISILLNSTNSWVFFHDYLFVYFVEGVTEILQIIKDATNTGPGASSIIALMIAPQTMAKLFSLLFIDWLGFIYIILFLIALYLIFMMIFKATIIYLTALIAIGMIITMAPIFICFILFSITRSLFENWLRQLISYALQPIILFTGLAFISMIIRSEIYSSLGFAVCKHDFPYLGPVNELFGSFTGDLDISIGNSIFYWWFPSPMKGEEFTKKMSEIFVPHDHRVQDGSKYGKLCLAYECKEKRYIELPFLDPDKDQRKIANFFNGKFVQLDSLLLIFLSVFLLNKFNDVAILIAKFISSTSGNLTNLQQIGQDAFIPIRSRVEQPIVKASNNIRINMNMVKEHITTPITRFFTRRTTIRLGQETLKAKLINPTVLNDTQGTSYRDKDINAISIYQNAIKARLKVINPGIDDTTLNKYVDQLSHKNFQQLQDSFAKLKFGQDKEYSSLNVVRKSQIDNLMETKYNEKTLRELANDASLVHNLK